MILKLKVWLLKKLLNDVSKHGHDGDVYLAHINKFEHKLLKAVGGEGSINPDTGLIQYKGGGGGSSNTKNELDPNVVPYVRDALSKQQALYNEGAPEYYAGQTYLDPNAQQQQAINMGTAKAQAGNPYLSGAQDTVGGLQSAVNPALAGYKSLQGNNITTGTNEALAGYRGLQGGNVNGALAGTQATARGDYLQNNPNFNAVMDTAGRKVTDLYNTATQGTMSDASKAGRYGSNAHARLQAGNAGKLAQSLSDTAGQYAYQNYANERGAQENAIGRLGDISNNQFNQQLQATQGLGSLGESQYGREMNAQQNNFSNQLSATQGLGSLSEQQAQRQMNASQMAGSLDNMQYQNIDRLANYGNQQAGFDQTKLNADIARHDYGQNAQQQHLSNYTNAVWGAPMGSSSSTSQSGGGK